MVLRVAEINHMRFVLSVADLKKYISPRQREMLELMYWSYNMIVTPFLDYGP